MNIDFPLSHIETIYHVSDIHIRNVKRHKEFKEVFSRLYNEIKKDTENSIIVLTGDIVHAKLELSPELVDLTFELFKNLADIVPTIIIAGNHDANLNNPSRLDVISPIVKNINNKNLFYFKDSGVYEVGDIKFVVMSVFDEPKNYIKASQIDAKTKIALYHGTVQNAITETGFKIHNEKINKKTFTGYDMVLLGDIHAKQTVSKYEIKEKIIDEKDLNKYIQNGWEIIEEL